MRGGTVFGSQCDFEMAVGEMGGVVGSWHHCVLEKGHYGEHQTGRGVPSRFGRALRAWTKDEMVDEIARLEGVIAQFENNDFICSECGGTSRGERK